MPAVTSANTRRLLKGRHRKPNTLPSAPVIQDAYSTPYGFIVILNTANSGNFSGGRNPILRYEFSLTDAGGQVDQIGSWVSNTDLTSVMPPTGLYQPWNYSNWYAPGDKVSVVESGSLKIYLCVTHIKYVSPLQDITGYYWIPLDYPATIKYAPLGAPGTYAAAFLFTPTYDTAYTVRVRAVTSIGTSASSAPFTTLEAGPVQMVGRVTFNQTYKRAWYGGLGQIRSWINIWLNTADLLKKHGGSSVPTQLIVRTNSWSGILNALPPHPFTVQNQYTNIFQPLRVDGAYTGYGIDTETNSNEIMFGTYPDYGVVLGMQQQAGKHWPGFTQQPDYDGILTGAVPEPWNAFTYTRAESFYG